MTELYSQSNEKFILKVMLNRSDHIVEIAQKLIPSDFYFDPYRILFTAIKKLSVKGDITSEGIMSLLESENKQGYTMLMNIGGAPAIENELRDNTMPQNPSIQSHIDILKSLTYRRNAVEASDILREMATSNLDRELNKQFEDVDELDSKIKETINSLSLSVGNEQLDEHVSEGFQELIESIKRGDSDMKGISIAHKYPKMDRMLKSLQPSKLIAFVAGAKESKSTVLLDLAYIVAKTGNPVLFGDSELSKNEFLIRLAAKISGLTQDQIINGVFVGDAAKESIMDDTLKEIEKLPLYWINTSAMSDQQLESTVKLYQMKRNISAFIFDYIKVLDFEGRIDKILDNRISMCKERIATDCGICVITALQKNANTGRSSDSAGIYKYADSIIDWQKLPLDQQYLGTHSCKLSMSRHSNYEDTIYFNIDGGKQTITEW